MGYANSGTLREYLKENLVFWKNKFKVARQLNLCRIMLHNEGVLFNTLL